MHMQVLYYATKLYICIYFMFNVQKNIVAKNFVYKIATCHISMYMHVYICACTYVAICACLYIHLCVCVCFCVNVCVCTSTVYVCMLVCVFPHFCLFCVPVHLCVSESLCTIFSSIHMYTLNLYMWQKCFHYADSMI